MGRRVITGVLAFAMVLWSLPLAASPALAAGSVSLTAVGTAYTENFDTLANTGTSSTTPNGWSLVESGTNANTTYTAGTGSANAGDTYSFGATGSSERAFGGLLSGSLTPTIGASFTNNTGATIARVDIAYTGEQWRLGTAGRGSDRLDFQFSTDATSVSTGTWSDANALDFNGPVTSGAVGALDGNAAANRIAVSGSVALSVPTGGTFWVRWLDFNASGADDGLGVDDFRLTPIASDSAPAISATSPLSGATDVPLDSTVVITFTEPVNVSGAWYSIVCSSGARTAAVTGGPTSFTLDPNSNFGRSEDCTVSIFAAQVTDLDSNDPPDNMAANFVFSFHTADVFSCGDPATFIHQVQGSGLASPISGTVVAIEGVVVGDYQGAGQFGGYYLQEESADTDADPATSEGIFVLSSESFRDVQAGDLVRVRGTVTEFGGLTELTSVSAVAVCSTGNAVAATVVTLPVTTYADFERYEGMLVRFTQTLTATETFTLARFGEVRLASDGRLYTPTAVTTPGAAAIAQEDLNRRRSFVLDDGNDQQNIDPTIHPIGGLSASNTLRSGYTVSALTGVFDDRFGAYRLQPVAPVPFAAANPRTAAPNSVGGNTKIASFNVLNYFNGNGTHQAGAAGGFPTARGATTLFELDRQTAKEVSALAIIDADVVGLSEIENDSGPASALADLVGALNARVGAGTYAYIDSGVIGTDAIKVAFIYKPATVTPVGAWRILTSSVDPRFIDTKNRPALAQTFQRNGTAEKVTVVANHLKSKGSGCVDVGDPDVGDGQGNCNVTRTRAAAAIVDWLATDPTASGSPNFLLVGDMNSYAFEDPITTFTNGGYTNLSRRFNGLTDYSYVFNGQAGYLDHALANTALNSRITGTSHWHINADEPIALDYNTEFKSANQVNTFYDSGPYRTSDHDPVVVGLDLRDTTPPTITAPAAVTVRTGLLATSCTKIVSDAALGAATASDDAGSVTIARSGVPAGNVFPKGVTTITYTATDGSGNTATATQTVTVVDDTPPSVTAPADAAYQLLSLVPAASGAAATAADNCGAPTVTVSQSDNGGAGSPASPLILTIVFTATDGAGNTASATQRITVIDDTPPTITGATTTSANSFGWWNTAVTVHFTCSDNSGHVTCPIDVVLSGDGALQSASGTATDMSGNSASVTVTGMNIDRTAPTFSWTGNAGTYGVDQAIAIDCVTTETLSGIDTSLAHNCDSIHATASSLGVGTYTVTAAATDRAGNSNGASTGFTISVDSTSLCGLTRTLVTKDGVGNSLCAKLESAAASLARGNTRAHDNQLQAFMNEVRAQRGKAISDADATLLIDLAGRL